MFILADRVKQTSVTTGTGDIVFNTTPPSFQSFADAIGDGNSTYYTIEGYTSFEVGIGTYTASTNSLSRDVVLVSSNNSAKIEMDGVSTVFCTYPAQAAFLLNSAGYATSFDNSYGGIKFPDGTIQTTAAITSVSKRIRAYRTLSSNDNISSDDDFVLLNCTSNSVTATLPLAGDVEGYTFTFKKTAGDYNANIVPQVGEEIDSGSSFTIKHVNTSISVFSDSNNWFIL